MVAIQEICARLGRITGLGIAANLKKIYPKYVAYSVVLLLFVANLFNLGADISAMAAAARLVFRGATTAYAMGFGGLSLLLQVFVPYRKYVQYLRWLTWSLFAYIVTAFLGSRAVGERASVDPGSFDFARCRVFDGAGGYARHDDQSLSIFLANIAGSRRSSREGMATQEKTLEGSTALSENCIGHARRHGVFEPGRVFHYPHDGRNIACLGKRDDDSVFG